MSIVLCEKLEDLLIDYSDVLNRYRSTITKKNDCLEKLDIFLLKQREEFYLQFVSLAILSNKENWYNLFLHQQMNNELRDDHKKFINLLRERLKEYQDKYIILPSKYQPGEFGYWWTVILGDPDIKGGVINGNIDPAINVKFTSLRGFPREVNGNVNLCGNGTFSGRDGPKVVHGNLYISNDQIGDWMKDLTVHGEFCIFNKTDKK